MSHYVDVDVYDYAWIVVLIWIVILGINIGLAFVVANLARKKGYSYGGFWALSFFAGFVIPLIVVLVLDDRTVPPYQQYYRPPYGQPYQQPYQPPYQPPYQQPAQSPCPNCGNNALGDAVFCPKCGTKIK